VTSWFGTALVLTTVARRSRMGTDHESLRGQRVREEAIVRLRAKLALSLGSVLVAALAVVPTAATSRAASVSGSWSTTPLTPTGFKQAGVNLKLPADVSSTWSGDLSGTTVATATFIIHPDGSVVAAPARETLSGTVDGVGSGTLTFVEEAHSQPDGSTEIDATITSGTGSLASLHGRVIFVGICDVSGACTGTYTGVIQG
jgi:hypothetical protein